MDDIAEIAASLTVLQVTLLRQAFEHGEVSVFDTANASALSRRQLLIYSRVRGVPVRTTYLISKRGREVMELIEAKGK